MVFSELLQGRLLRRYKRFLADVELDNGEQITVHCPNTGAMTGCAEPGAKVWLSVSVNPKRKYRHTWEMVSPASGDMICVHSALANKLVEEAIRDNRIPELSGYTDCRREVRYGAEGSRADFCLTKQAEQCFIEVKSVTLLADNQLGLFPDAVSQRGSKHLRELIEVKQQGARAVLFFAVLHTGIHRVAPADSIDALYGNTLREAMSAGVEVIAYGAEIQPPSIYLNKPLPVLSSQPE